MELSGIKLKILYNTALTSLILLIFQINLLKKEAVLDGVNQNDKFPLPV